jgi:hypothetical protein
MKTSLKLVLPLAGLAVMAMGSAKADAVADFYKGKTVSIFVGVSPGGIYSTFAQFLAKHMKRHFPGNPDIIVKHMPGGGGMKANNYVYNVAPRDGTALLTPNSSPAKNVLFGKGAKYDPVKFNWVGSWGSTTNALSLLKKNKPAATTMEEAKPGRSSSAPLAVRPAPLCCQPCTTICWVPNSRSSRAIAAVRQSGLPWKRARLLAGPGSGRG